jgi:hypothetical protein
MERVGRIPSVGRIIEGICLSDAESVSTIELEEDAFQVAADRRKGSARRVLNH